MPNKPEYLLVHTSDSPFGNRKTINDWHLARGFAEIGYHYGIGSVYPTGEHYRKRQAVPEHDGLLFTGRDLDKDGDIDEEIGAHCPGYNSRSLSVCLIGKDGKYSDRQLVTLYYFLASKCLQYSIPAAHILGHCETPNGKSQGKTCPVLPMDNVRKRVQTLIDAMQAEQMSLLPQTKEG